MFKTDYDWYFGLALTASIAWGVWGLHILYENWGQDFNARGDFMAGWFAPLAFFWFIYTTFIQRKELQLTRKELSETREQVQRQADAQEKQVSTQLLEQFGDMLRSLQPPHDLDHKPKFVTTNNRVAQLLINLTSGHFGSEVEDIATTTQAIRHAMPLTKKQTDLLRKYCELSLNDYRQHMAAIQSVDEAGLLEHPVLKVQISTKGWHRVIWCRHVLKAVENSIGLTDSTEVGVPGENR